MIALLHRSVNMATVFTLFTLFISVAIMTGCVGKNDIHPYSGIEEENRPLKEENPADGKININGFTASNFLLENFSYENEKPIVKIIKGDIVDAAEAQKLITSEKIERLQGMSEHIESLILRDVPVHQISQLLTELCGYNVVSTRSVADQEISIFMQDITLRSALETICKLNNLWFREGDNIVTLMTRQEYVQDIEIRQNEHTRAFHIRYTNAADMAKVIQALMGSEVFLSAIEDEKIYGHVDPEADVSMRGGGYSRVPDLNENAPSQRIILMNTPAVRPRNTTLNRRNADFNRLDGQVGTAQASQPAKGGKPLLAILTVFKRNNSIIARSLDASLLNEMGKIIGTLDTPTSQVLLEVQILQISLEDEFESFFKIDYGDYGGAPVVSRIDPSTTLIEGAALGLLHGATTAASTIGAVFDTNNIRARISLFESEGRVNNVSSPFLMSANNSTVEFFVGEEVPLRDGISKETIVIGDGRTLNTFLFDTTTEELGTTLTMSTFINEDNTVTMEIDAEISSIILNFSSVTTVDDGGNMVEFALDGISKSEIKSIVTTKSGQTIALGGIIRETIQSNEKQIPILGDIPVLGFLFKQKWDETRKTETVIVLTPHIINHPGFSGEATTRFLNRKSSNKKIIDHTEKLLTD